MAEEVFRSVRSHFARAREGWKLLKAGRSLSEMQTKIEGPGVDYLIEQRLRYIEKIEGLDEDALEQELGVAEEKIQKMSQHPEAGTSEMEWRRNVILSRL